MAKDLTPLYIKAPAPSVHLDPEEFDRQIRGHAVRLIHWRGFRCPVGVLDLHDGRRTHPDHEGCSNGTLFTRAGVIKALLIGDSKEKKRVAEGLLDAGSAQVTVPRNYEDSSERVLLAPGDRLTFEDENILVTQSEMVRASGMGTDRLLRYVVKVLDLVDSAGLRYVEGSGFEVKGGRIAWTGSHPVQDPASGMPAVYSVRYLYHPAFYVSHLLHEMRIGHRQGVKGEEAILMPQLASVVREYLWRGTREQDPEALKNEEPGRQALAPEEVQG